MPSTDSNSWGALLQEAITKPGTLSEAYSYFHNYSIGNQILALVQCQQRGIQPGPIATFPAWKDKGRFVRKGEKALMLCMPITCKSKDEVNDHEGTFTRFIYRNRWFVLSQTEGEPVEPTLPPTWDKAHVCLGHTTEGEVSDAEHTPKSLREAEAECVALILCESLSLPGAEYCRGYVQDWLKGSILPEKSAQKIFQSIVEGRSGEPRKTCTR